MLNREAFNCSQSHSQEILMTNLNAANFSKYLLFSEQNKNASSQLLYLVFVLIYLS